MLDVALNKQQRNQAYVGLGQETHIGGLNVSFINTLFASQISVRRYTSL